MRHNSNHVVLLSSVLCALCFHSLLPSSAAASSATAAAAGTSSGGMRMDEVTGFDKRAQAGFYTTRFGRSDPSLSSASARMILRQQQQQQLAESAAAAAAAPGMMLQRVFARPNDMKIGYSIEGYDDRGHAVSCVFAGSKSLYICQVEQEASSWSL